MANYVIQDTTLTNIANAIREKSGSEDAYKPTEMAAAISAIKAGGSEFTIRTPDEIYAQDRSADWPVLPDPTEDNECYFLCKTIKDGNLRYVCYPQNASKKDIEWGYIDEDGKFVTAYTLTNETGSYWSRFTFSTTSSSSWDSHMEEYHVIRTTKGDSTYEEPSSSTLGSESTMSRVLEIKARISDPSFGTLSSSYSNAFRNCQFVTLYGPQNWSSGENKFKNMRSLSCLRFDSEENNIFLQPNNRISTVKNMFYYCYALQYAYPILQHWTALTNIYGLYESCTNVPYIVLENDKVTESSYAIRSCYGLERVSLILPNAKNVLVQNSSSYANIFARVYENFDLTSLSTGWQGYMTSSFTQEIYNLKISNESASSNNVLSPTGWGVNGIRKVIMSPEQSGDDMPAAWRINLRHAGRADVTAFFESLPVTTKGTALTFSNFYLYYTQDEAVLSIATNKGYTVSVTTS